MRGVFVESEDDQRGYLIVFCPSEKSHAFPEFFVKVLTKSVLHGARLSIVTFIPGSYTYETQLEKIRVFKLKHHNF